MSSTGFTVHAEPIGGSPLARAAQAGTAPRSWYPPAPRGAAAWRARCSAIGAEFSGGGWLRALAAAFQASGAALERLERVAAAGGVVVTTGQQPGLFGGPVYTWSKAIGALGMADALEEIGAAAAPVFWAATDDADFEEASRTTLAIRGGVRDLRLTQAPAPGTPMAGAPLAPLDAELAALAEACGSAPYVEALDAARAAYAAGRTVGEAFLLLLRRILEPLGIPVLDASHPAVRAASRPLVARAIARAAATDAALEARDRELLAAGHRPQVERVAGLAPVFVLEGGVKRRLRVGEGVPDGHDLAPNVLLRPVVERSILPTVAYFAGPGELAYFAQVSAVAAALEAPAPLALPRWSVTIVEDHAQMLLRRLDATVEELRDPHAAAGRLARAAMPASVERALETLRATVASALGRVAEDPEAARLLPAPALEGAARALNHRLDRIERRFLAAVKREEVQLMTDLATARGYFYPHDGRQERMLNFLPFLARQGRPLLEAMRAAATRYARAIVQ
ncbi:MAG: bacillithiol biosynthesis protein BshC [Gemmatimonadaceae bacterium]